MAMDGMMEAIRSIEDVAKGDILTPKEDCVNAKYWGIKSGNDYEIIHVIDRPFGVVVRNDRNNLCMFRESEIIGDFLIIKKGNEDGE